uniref:Cyclic nucleotide-gated cation channel alpha-3 n=1 Tax=Cacopsylla melanoneura TaxID=428564 RepID=A0A8D8QUC8_9HEMI
MSNVTSNLMQSLTDGGRRQSEGPGSSSSKLVHGNQYELEEISIVSNQATSNQVKYGSGPLYPSANGPKVIPGILTTGPPYYIGERLSASSGTKLDSSSLTSLQDKHRKSSSESLKLSSTIRKTRPNILETINQRFRRNKHHQPHKLFSSSQTSVTGYVNRGVNISSTPSEFDLPKTGICRSRRDSHVRQAKLQPLTANLTGEKDKGFGSNTKCFHGNTGADCAVHRVAERYPRASGPNLTFVFDPAGRFSYYWSMIVSLAFLYNFWVIIYRFAFQEINRDTLVVWFCLDYVADFMYVIDILIHFRTGYLEDGVLQTDSTKLRDHYMNSTTFYIDCLCLLPLDFLYLSIGFNSILRLFRLVKIYRFWAFMDRTERHTNYPNLFRSSSLIHYLLVIFHWNGCLYHIIYKNDGFGSRNWVYGDNDTTDVVKQYLQSYYWCTLALTTIGDLPRPRTKGEYFFVIVQLLFGLLLFATVLGHVANIVTSVSAARKEFQAKLDGVKTYMRMRRVPNQLQVKVIKWFDYLWLTQKCSDEEKAVSCLPDKLKAEIAINVHLDTLKRVEIFQNTEAGFLCELVLRLRPVLFSPGDYICRKGEVGKEMYIVNRGRLQVVADNGKTVLATLRAGSYFGEISILNMGTAGNRRTASVRSVGYSDLFVLSKTDMWDVLKEYPAARVRLESIAVKRLQKYKRTPLEKDTPDKVKGAKFASSAKSLRPGHEAHQKPEGKQETSDKSGDEDGNKTDDTEGMQMSNETLEEEIRDEKTTTSSMSQEAFIAEIKRLRERLILLETENATLNVKLNTQQWEVEHRLAEIEMQICGGSSLGSSVDEERNRESMI